MISKSLLSIVFLISPLYAPHSYEDYSHSTLRGGPKDVLPEIAARYKEELHYDLMHDTIEDLKKSIQTEQNVFLEEQAIIHNMQMDNAIHCSNKEHRKHRLSDLVKNQIALEKQKKLIGKQQAILEKLEMRYTAWLKKNKNKK